MSTGKPHNCNWVKFLLYLYIIFIEKCIVLLLKLSPHFNDICHSTALKAVLEKIFDRIFRSIRFLSISPFCEGVWNKICFIMLLQFVFMLVNISLLYVCVMPNPGGVLNDFRKSRHQSESQDQKLTKIVNGSFSKNIILFLKTWEAGK